MIASSLLSVLLVLCLFAPEQLGPTKKGDAVTGCATIAKACDSFVDNVSNPNGEFPKTLAELHSPPWGGGSYLPDGKESLRDPWGNLYMMQQRTRDDGQPYLLIATYAPDGTLISQHGTGPRAVPPHDREQPPNEGGMMSKTWLNPGTALGLLLGVCIGAGAVATWYSTRERAKEDAKVEPPPKEVPQPTPPTPEQLLKGAKEKARLGCVKISKAIDSYALSSSNPGNSDEERLPPALESLLSPVWSTSFLPDGSNSLIDPWGKKYQPQQSAREDGTAYIIVFTRAPDGTPISQFGIGAGSRVK